MSAKATTAGEDAAKHAVGQGDPMSSDATGSGSERVTEIGQTQERTKTDTGETEISSNPEELGRPDVAESDANDHLEIAFNPKITNKSQSHADNGANSAPKSAAQPFGDTPPATKPLGDIFASAIWLMMASPDHKHLTLKDLQQRLIPPLMLRQFRLFRKDGQPVAFATWAMVPEDIAWRPTATNQDKLSVKPTQWRSGEHPRLVDIVAQSANMTAVQDFMLLEVLKYSEKPN